MIKINRDVVTKRVYTIIMQYSTSLLETLLAYFTLINAVGKRSEIYRE